MTDPATPLLSTKYAAPPTPGAGSSTARHSPLRSPPPAASCSSARRRATARRRSSRMLAAIARPAARGSPSTTGDNDPAVFGAYLRRPSLSRPPDRRHRGRAHAGGRSVGPARQRDRRPRSPGPVVLDDYHVIDDAGVHEMTAFLARHLPANARLVIATRHDPPLPLARLRARGLLTEIRADDLRFDADAASRFLAGAMGLELPGRRSSGSPSAPRAGWRASSSRGSRSVARPTRRPSSRRSARPTATSSSTSPTRSSPPSPPTSAPSSSRRACSAGSRRACATRSPVATTARRCSRPLAQLQPVPRRARRSWRVVPLPPAVRGPRRVGPRRRAAPGAPPPRRRLVRRARPGGRGDPALACRGRRGWRRDLLIERAADRTLARGETTTLLGWCEALPAAVVARAPGPRRRAGVGDVHHGRHPGRGADPRRSAARRAGMSGRTAARRACLEAWFANRHDLPEAEALARDAVERTPETDPVFRSLAFTTLGESIVGRDVHGGVRAFEEANRARDGHRAIRPARRDDLLARQHLRDRGPAGRGRGALPADDRRGHGRADAGRPRGWA